MKKFKSVSFIPTIIITLFFLLFWLLPSVSFAQGQEDGIHSSFKAGGDVGVSDLKAETENNLEVDADSQQTSFIRGTISALSGNSFVVGGKTTIVIDPSKVAEFSQKGNLAVGSRVKVSFVSQNGVNYAKEINVIGTGQGRFQIKMNEPSENSSSDNLSSSSNANVNFSSKVAGHVSGIAAFFQELVNAFASIKI
ncbi:DUF5666 domain-containing protein [Patescibacteria group bacterium]|nr:DUF5666 domain-containing protein [Patescibacteria group bacterium]MCL5010304.1 DUF5666 domain-containing protein [Patescibacteria group bacterium]